MQRPWGSHGVGLFENSNGASMKSVRGKVVANEVRGVGGTRSCRGWQAIVRTLAKEQTWMQRRNKGTSFP